MKVIIFCRVSSKEQSEQGYSLPAQEKILKAYAERNLFQIERVFSISESASGKKQREIFSEMMDYIQKENIKVIICEKVDRLTRNFKDAVMIDEWLEKDEERQVHLVKDSLVLHKNSRSQEKLNWGIRIIFAKNYIDNLSEEVKKGQKEKVDQGWLPTKPPLGYKTIGDRGHKIHVVDETTAPLIRKMFELYSTGQYSIKYLTKTMYNEGLRNLSGKGVVKSRIHILLQSQFYIGKNVWNDQVYDGKQEPLITKEMFETVQSLLKRRNILVYRKHFFLFKALINCFECGGMITWETKKGHNYGHCHHNHVCTQTIWVKEPDIESQLIKGFENLQVNNPRIAEWIRKALKESHQDQIAYHTTSINELNRRQEQIKQRLDKLYDEKIDEKITEEFYQQKYQQYSLELENVTNSIRKHGSSTLNYFEQGLNIYNLAQRAKEIYSVAQLDQKRQLISQVFDNLLVDKGKLFYKYSAPFNLLATAVEATNKSSKTLEDTVLRGKIFEPNKKTDFTDKSSVFSSLSPIWLWRMDSDHQHPL